MHSPVLVATPLQADLQADLVRRHDARLVVGPEGPGRLASLRASGARVVVTNARVGLSTVDLDALPDLQAVVSFGVGTDALDLDALRSRGIAVATTPDVLTDAVADLAVGLVVDVLRGTVAADRLVKAGRWATDGPPPLARQVTGRRVGVLGLGRIGRAVAERLVGFRCPVAYHNRQEVPDVPWTRHASPEELARWCEVLVVTAPGSATPLVGRRELEALGPDGILVNVGRGSVVDEGALVDALVQGRVAGAGLDVFADEPRPHPGLLELGQVVLTPHIGSATEETRRAMSELVLSNVTSWLDHGRLVTPLRT
jgi:lactate dehydrogenase-like 2-hydroxyacid dehydrogenase